MSYTTLLVRLRLGESNEGLLKVAASLAERLKAGVVGMAACHPLPIAYGDIYLSAEAIRQEREETEKQAGEAEAAFRAALKDHAARIEWKSVLTVSSLVDCIAKEARAADLILASPDTTRSGDTQHLGIGDLVMRAGRPVLVVPPGSDTLDLGHVIVAWKDGREARRAVRDAIPLLRLATEVSVIEVAREDDLPAAREHVGEVARWLGLHGIAAKPVASPTDGDDARTLDVIATARGAGLIVAGAYGHSRAREWAFGGVTYDLLFDPKRYVLLSH